MLGPRLEHQLEVARSLPKGRFAVIPDAGQFVVYDAPETILPIIGRFAARLHARHERGSGRAVDPKAFCE